jgi:hypothetical protein
MCTDIRRERLLPGQDNRLTYVVGEAGCGKTSLLNVGVLPLLDTDKVTVLPVGRLSYGMAFPFATVTAVSRRYRPPKTALPDERGACDAYGPLLRRRAARGGPGRSRRGRGMRSIP